jgi:UDP-glucuronate 4-epimerase
MILVTGAAGFIGFHLCRRLLKEGWEVLGIDRLEAKDEIIQRLQGERLKILANSKTFYFIQADIRDEESLKKVFDVFSPINVVHLAARAGVRASFDEASSYFSHNAVGSQLVADWAGRFGCQHFICTSSSSIFGEMKGPTAEDAVSPYAFSKVKMEEMVVAASSEWQIKTTILRPFTVYGPWGRPDMAYFKFANQMMKHEEISLFNGGENARDFTFIDDFIEGMIRVIGESSERQSSLLEVFNFGRGKPESTGTLLQCLESNLRQRAQIRKEPRSQGESLLTWADSTAFFERHGYQPQIALEEGLKIFCDWHQGYFKNECVT